VEGKQILKKMIMEQKAKVIKTKKIPSWLKTRTKSERNAYNALPDILKAAAIRNPRFSYKKGIAYRSDILFPNCKVWIEIDGSSHIGREKEDKRKDERLTERGFAVIRFQNEETEDKQSFLHKLLNKLILIEDRNNRGMLNKYIRCLENYLIYDFDEEEYITTETEISEIGFHIR